MKILFAVDPSDMPRLQAFIQAQNWTDVDFIQSSDSFYEMLPKQVSKGSALIEYRKRFRLENPRLLSWQLGTMKTTVQCWKRQIMALLRQMHSLPFRRLQTMF